MPKAKELPINCAARNAVWVYPRLSEPRFPGPPAVVETTRSYEMPAIYALPDGADVAVELYGGACALRLDGENNPVYVRRFHYAGFATQEEALRALLDLWREVERLGSAEEVEGAAERWVERRGRQPHGSNEAGILPASLLQHAYEPVEADSVAQGRPMMSPRILPHPVSDLL